jgi:hypothetical protein
MLLPLILNETSYSCIHTFDKVDWIDKTDSCQAFDNQQ